MEHTRLGAERISLGFPYPDGGEWPRSAALRTLASVGLSGRDLQLNPGQLICECHGSFRVRARDLEINAAAGTESSFGISMER
jgi:hypothetical protein